MSRTTIRAEMAQAIRIVNAAYHRLDFEDRERVNLIGIEPVEAALEDRDDDRALAAVADWSHRQLAAIREVAR